MQHSQTTWLDWWRILFRSFPDQSEADAMQSYLDAAFPGRGAAGDGRWTPAELIDALQAIAERQRADGKAVKSPTAPQIKSAIIRARWESRGGQRERAEACAICNGGWIDVAPDLPGDGFGIGEYQDAYRLVAPCDCGAGNAAMARAYKKADDEVQKRLRTLSALGRAQRAHYARLQREVK